MKLAYVDCSGGPNFEPGCFVISSVLVDSSDWHHMEEKIDKIKKRHFPEKYEQGVELHASDMVRRRGSYKYVPFHRIASAWDDLFDTISDPATPIILISIVFRKELMQKRIDLVELGYTMLLERIEYHMEKDLQKAGSGNQALLVLDNEEHMRNAALLKKILPILRNGSKYCQFGHIIRPPLFVDSKTSNMIQISDSVAYAIQKKYGISSGDNAERWVGYFGRLGPKFDSVGGSYEGAGLKIFPK